MAVKSSKMHTFRWKFSKLLIFHDPYVKNKSIFKNRKFWIPNEEFQFFWFSGTLLLFSTDISKWGRDISIPIINHHLELGKCFPTINERIL